MPQATQPVSNELLTNIEAQLTEDLTQPRLLIEQVLQEIASRYEYDGERLEAFFKEKYPELEDYQIDLVFSPLFTPNWEDQIRYAKLLGNTTLQKADLKALCDKLEKDQLQGTFQTQSGNTWSVPMHIVCIDRFVNRLQLDKTLSPTLAKAIETNVPDSDQHTVSLLARNSVWDGDEREALLKDYLDLFKKNGSFSVEKTRFLTDFVRTYRPFSHDDLVRQLESLVKSCEADLNNVSDHSFFDKQFKELYSDSERAHFKNIGVQNHYQELMTRSQELLADYQATK